MASLSCRIEMRGLVSAPPCEQSMNALDSIPARIKRATTNTNVAECAATYPKQASHLSTRYSRRMPSGVFVANTDALANLCAAGCDVL